MTRILCLDATTEACSVALLNGDDSIARYQVSPRQHAALLLPFVEELLEEAGLGLGQIDAIACHVGPGAFTGIRIGVSVAQGLAYGAGLPCIAISSLQNLAQQAFSESSEDHCLAAIDARMQQVYFAHYQRPSGANSKLVGEEMVVTPSNIDFQEIHRSAGGNMLKIGSGWPAYGEMTEAALASGGPLIKDRFPDARFSLELALAKYQAGETHEASGLQPVYLRNQVAQKSQKGSRT